MQWESPPKTVLILTKPNSASVQTLCSEMVRYDIHNSHIFCFLYLTWLLILGTNARVIKKNVLQFKRGSLELFKVSLRGTIHIHVNHVVSFVSLCFRGSKSQKLFLEG